MKTSQIPCSLVYFSEIKNWMFQLPQILVLSFKIVIQDTAATKKIDDIIKNYQLFYLLHPDYSYIFTGPPPVIEVGPYSKDRLGVRRSKNRS